MLRGFHFNRDGRKKKLHASLVRNKENEPYWANELIYEQWAKIQPIVHDIAAVCRKQLTNAKNKTEMHLNGKKKMVCTCTAATTNKPQQYMFPSDSIDETTIRKKVHWNGRVWHENKRKTFCALLLLSCAWRTYFWNFNSKSLHVVALRRDAASGPKLESYRFDFINLIFYFLRYYRSEWRFIRFIFLFCFLRPRSMVWKAINTQSGNRISFALLYLPCMIEFVVLNRFLYLSLVSLSSIETKKINHTGQTNLSASTFKKKWIKQSIMWSDWMFVSNSRILLHATTGNCTCKSVSVSLNDLFFFEIFIVNA